ncbi:MAG: Uncharacterized protein FD123_2408 [Bacteroidetes bacterium]|nr:MAG: Uncharacterized protein FD123_2408 [Bacteroidota bacterium]
MIHLSQFFDIDTHEKAKQLQEFLIEEQPFSIGDSKVPSNNLQNYFKYGLINPPSGNKVHYRFNFIELIWLNMVADLRDIGVPIDTLRLLNKELNTSISEKKLYRFLKDNPHLIDSLPISAKEKAKIKKEAQSKDWSKEKGKNSFTFLQLLIAHAIVHRELVCIAVFLNGTFAPLIDAIYSPENKELLYHLKTQIYYNVPVSGYMQSVIGENRFESMLPRIGLFTDKELKLLEIVRSGEYQSVTVRFKNDKMNVIEMEKSVDVHRRLIDIISESPFAHISVHTQHYKPAQVKHTTKVKV